MKFQILICSLEKRSKLLWRLLEILMPQTSQNEDVTFLIDIDNGEDSIGKKRNRLLKESTADYVAFIDDDDRISNNYVDKILKGIENGVDCCSLRGIITENGGNPLVFEHSIKYNSYKTNPVGEVRYERFPNHLNCIKASIAKQFKFPEKNHGEDTDWATQIHKSGLIKTEHYIPEILYYYDYVSNK